MRLTPLDIREQQFRRVMRGLDPEEVEAFLATVATEFEQLVAGNNELRQRVVELEERMQEYRSMEKALRDTLLTAEKVMGDAKESAQREAALIIREAEVAVQRSKGRLQQDLVQLQNELAELRRVKDAYLTRVRWLLRSQLEMIDGHAHEFAEIDAAFAPPGTTPEPPQYAPEPGAAAAQRPTWSAAQPHAGVPHWDGPEWQETAAVPPPTGLGDALRPVSSDGTYERPLPAPRATTPDEIADAARRAERLAAEARAALERRGQGGAGWGLDRSRDEPR